MIDILGIPHKILRIDESSRSLPIYEKATMESESTNLPGAYPSARRLRWNPLPPSPKHHLGSGSVRLLRAGHPVRCALLGLSAEGRRHSTPRKYWPT
ncbi:unnamed protein product [Linum trigynum]|uniref:Uncharacterized protein n=1 Tax=Linum trigynum TaxID=586398 RepID=A0AAV2CT95_9ROSI